MCAHCTEEGKESVQILGYFTYQQASISIKGEWSFNKARKGIWVRMSWGVSSFKYWLSGWTNYSLEKKFPASLMSSGGCNWEWERGEGVLNGLLRAITNICWAVSRNTLLTLPHWILTVTVWGVTPGTTLIDSLLYCHLCCRETVQIAFVLTWLRKKGGATMYRCSGCALQKLKGSIHITDLIDRSLLWHFQQMVVE